jgi:hypothetical protein
MRHSLMKLACFLLILFLSLMMYGCSPVKPSTNPNLIWKVDLLKYEVKNKLESIEIVAQYIGSTEEVHLQSPAEGNVYLIMKVTISKQGVETTPFDWKKLSVLDNAGNTYQRISNDTFLEQFKYTPRMTGLEIKFGVNEGWMCYEIPAQVANDKLTLIYNAEGSQQEIVIKK